MTPVVRILSTIFCAVPALSRVEPVRASGPVTASMAMSASCPMVLAALLETETVAAPSERA